jgi:hypothetical protein
MALEQDHVFLLRQDDGRWEGSGPTGEVDGPMDGILKNLSSANWEVVAVVPMTTRGEPLAAGAPVQVRALDIFVKRFT